MSNSESSQVAKSVVRRNTEEVQGKGNFDAFEELFDDDFIDHTPQPGMTPDKRGARGLYKALREAFPDFHFETVDAMRVHKGKIIEHWGVANLFSLMQQLGAHVTAKPQP